MFSDSSPDFPSTFTANICITVQWGYNKGFGNKDLEVWTKEKGTDEPFAQISLREFLGNDSIPDYEDDIKWRKVKDRAPRRRVSSSRSTSPEGRHSPGPATGQQSGGKPAGHGKKVNEIGINLRQLSVNSDDELPNKRRRGESASMDSCKSKDLEAALKQNEEGMEEDLDGTL